jgi:hypothetical protein
MRVTMPRHGFPEEFHCGFSIPALGHKGFQDFAFVIDGPPEVAGGTVDFCGNPIQMPPPVGQGPHSVDPLAADLGGEHRAEAVPPEPHGLMADVAAALLQQVFDVAQPERLTDGHRHGKTDDLRASLEVLEWGVPGHLGRAGRALPIRPVCSDKAAQARKDQSASLSNTGRSQAGSV